MRKPLIGAIIAVISAVPLLWAGPLTPFGGEQGFANLQLEPNRIKGFTIECKGGERTVLIAIGRGTTPLGAYVYDPHGNCVAWDDLSISPQNITDDIAVAWYPPRDMTYDIELRNPGRVTNRVEVAIH